MPPLHSRRLTMRAFTMDDAAFIVELLNDPGWLQHIGDRKVRSLDDARRYLENGPMAHHAKHGFALGAVDLKESGATIGMCGLIRRDTLPDVDIGYAFLPAWRGRGYAREAAAAWLEHGFAKLNLPRIVAITTLDNEPSARVLESIGMRFEQQLRLAGNDHDSNLYALDRLR